MTGTEPILQLRRLTRHFGSVRAVDGVTLTVTEGSRHAVIGPNGAGKTTLFALAAGTTRPTAGTVHLAGRDVTRRSDHQRARLGMARSFQHSSVFPTLSALDNVRLATQRDVGRPVAAWGRGARSVAAAAEEALETVGLADRRDVRAGALSHGQRRQLELALALALRPRLVLLDEPTAGMSEGETERFVGLVSALPGAVTIMLIEHDLHVVFALASDVTVLHLGRVLASGTPEQIRASEKVQRCYLGEETMSPPEHGPR